MGRERHVFVYLRALTFLVIGVNSFAPGSRMVMRRSLSFLGGTTEGGEKSSSTSRKNANDGERTLYDILNASPNDSQEQLRRRYTKAARLTHPDAAQNGLKKDEGMADFSEIAHAWSVLSDPKERLRYDRRLKAEEFATSMGSLIDTGMSVAVPFLFETAPQQINRTAADLGKTMQDVGERLDKARTVAELKRKSSEMVNRATKERSTVDELQARLRSDRRLDTLRNGKSELSSTQAHQIVRGFQFLESSIDSYVAVDTLAQVEEDHNKKSRAHQSMKKELGVTEQKVDSARQYEELVEERLEDAQRKLEEARAAGEKYKTMHSFAVQQEEEAARNVSKTEEKVEFARQDEELAKERMEEARLKLEEARAARRNCEKTHSLAAQEEKNSIRNLRMIEQRMESARLDEKLGGERLEDSRRKLEEARTARENSEKTHSLTAQQEKRSATDLDKATAALVKQRDATRQALRRTEDLDISKERTYLKEESKRLEVRAAKLLAKAQELRSEADELERASE